VIEAKQETYTDRLNEYRLADISIEAVEEFVGELDHPGPGVTQAE
jgi:hypothetical protein